MCLCWNVSAQDLSAELQLGASTADSPHPQTGNVPIGLSVADAQLSSSSWPTHQLTHSKGSSILLAAWPEPQGPWPSVCHSPYLIHLPTPVALPSWHPGPAYCLPAWIREVASSPRLASGPLVRMSMPLCCSVHWRLPIPLSERKRQGPGSCLDALLSLVLLSQPFLLIFFCSHLRAPFLIQDVGRLLHPRRHLTTPPPLPQVFSPFRDVTFSVRPSPPSKSPSPIFCIPFLFIFCLSTCH